MARTKKSRGASAFQLFDPLDYQRKVEVLAHFK